MNNNDCFPEDENFHYYSHGDGQPVILIHGFGASNYDWTYLTPDLIESGYQVIAPDLIGHGNSNKPVDPECYSFSALYDHFTGWINTFGQDKDLTLIGHSMGGSIALLFASEHPDAIRQIVLIDPYYDRKQLNSILRSINKRPEWYQKALQITPQWLIHTAISLDVIGLIHYESRTRHQIAEDYKRASPQIVYLPGTIPDIANKINKIQSPTLVIWGTNDATLRPKSFPQLVEILPNGQGKAIKGGSHQPHLKKPKLFNQLVLDFLEP